jgi:hypothetical protein
LPLSISGNVTTLLKQRAPAVPRGLGLSAGRRRRGQGRSGGAPSDDAPIPA